MKILRFSLIRALIALVAGVLLLKYEGAMLKGFTVGLGLMFLVAGVVAIIGWLNLRRQKMTQKTTLESTVLPIAGVGSFFLGLVLALMLTDKFDIWSLYLVGSSLIIGCLNQVMNLNAARKFGKVDDWYWIAPMVIVAACVVAMVMGLEPANVPTKILGVGALIFAIVDLIYSLILNNLRRNYEQTQEQVRRSTGVNTNAVVVTSE